MKTKTIFLSLTGIFIFSITGCSVYTDIATDYDRSVNFLSYKSFAWLADKDTSETEFNNQIIRNNTRNYFTHCMGERGFKTSVDTPDVFLYLVVTAAKKEKIITSPVSSYPPNWYYHNPYYYPYPGNYYYRYPYNYNYTILVSRKIEYTEGSITLNIIDRKLNRLVWTGTAKGDLYDPAYIGDNLHPAVYDILNDYPVKPIQDHKRPKK